MNIRFHSLVGAIAETHEAPLRAVESAVEAVARSMGYPRPVDTGIWPRDAYSVIRLVEGQIQK